jgi:hypothetical protein
MRHSNPSNNQSATDAPASPWDGLDSCDQPRCSMPMAGDDLVAVEQQV